MKKLPRGLLSAPRSIGWGQSPAASHEPELTKIQPIKDPAGEKRSPWIPSIGGKAPPLTRCLPERSKSIGETFLVFASKDQSRDM